jgi:glycerol-3-phosphate dehydrogenase subunit C
MSNTTGMGREGSLEAPTRHALNWREDSFYDEASLMKELERVYDICHSCRRCVSLCDSFPSLFDLIDKSPTFELDGVAKQDYWKVVDECFLCDLCYQSKCPYVPPHEWNIDFPHLMLRAKAIQFKKGERKLSHRLISNTRITGTVGSIPLVGPTINAANRSPVLRKILQKTLDIHPNATLPDYHVKTLRRRTRNHQPLNTESLAAGPTRGRVALFATCYCNINAPGIGEDLLSVFEHNGIPVRMTPKEQCCGMPKLEQGDLQTVDKYKRKNIPQMLQLIDEGWDIVAAIPSCVLMFKQELPLMYPDDEDVQKVRQHIFDPFEYLWHRHKAGLLKTKFSTPVGTVAWHVPCHQRVQNIGPKTRQVLSLIPDADIQVIERCSGHDGTYGVRNSSYEKSRKLVRPVVKKVRKVEADYLVSDCPMAATQIADDLELKHGETNPLSLLRKAYGI